MPRGVDVAGPGREQQRGVATLDDVAHPGRIEPGGARVDAPRPWCRADVHVRSELDQRLHDVGVLLRHGPHQHRLSPGAFLGIQSGAMGG